MEWFLEKFAYYITIFYQLRNVGSLMEFLANASKGIPDEIFLQAQMI